MRDSWEEATPRATATFESLRGVGYDLATAVADIIDNSITAGASEVSIRCAYQGASSYLSIIDNGQGMTEDELSSAMRIGSKNPLENRAQNDLGRFGMGLKTASLSQCRRMSVATARGNARAFRCWDLDYVASVNDWHLLKVPHGSTEALMEPLSRQTQGTIVVWEHLDRLVDLNRSEDSSARRAFLRRIERMEHHLGMVFHRFLSGSRPSLRIFINSTANAIKPWDPFLTDNPATYMSPMEKLDADTVVQGFVLPHKDRLSKQEFINAGGPDGWVAQQGFYVYRNDRLLMPGSWLGLGSEPRWTKEESFKLARLSVEFRNQADLGWKIDIKKSVARPPEQYRKRMTELATSIRTRARSVFAHRGTYGPRNPGKLPVSRIWLSHSSGDHSRYRLDREHPAVLALAESSGSHLVEDLLRIVEETVPVQRIWLDAAEKGVLTPEPFQDNLAEIRTIGRRLYQTMRRARDLSPDEACQELARMEPFNLYPSIVAELGESDE